MIKLLSGLLTRTATMIAITAIETATIAQQPSPATPARQTAGGRLTFEVASIRRNGSGEQGGSVQTQPGARITAINETLSDLIRIAYNIQPFEMVTGPQSPAWLDSERWDISGRSTEQASQDEMRQMLQNLLADRFKLDARRETREMPIYALVLARSDGRLGPNLRRSDVDCVALAAAARAGAPPPSTPKPTSTGVFCGGRTMSGSIAMHGVPLANFVRNLSTTAGRVVVDKTGLIGPFELELRFAPERPSAGGAASDPSLFTAIQEQLGLRLEAQRAPVEVLVIGSAEKPAEI